MRTTLEEIIYLNGDLIPRSKAKLSPFNFGFLYGYGIFETMRSYHGSVFRLDGHLARLHESARVLGIDNKLAAFDLTKACSETLQANNLTDARLRLTVTLGEGDIVPNTSTTSGITVFIAVRKMAPLPMEIYERGYSAIISKYRRNSRSPLAHIKSTSYLESFLARQEAAAAGVDEVIMLNSTGFLAEGSRTNIFLLNQKMLLTPSIESGILPGITREVVLELAKSVGIATAIRQVKLSELLTASEAFLTSSTLEIMPLTLLDNKPIGKGQPGTVTRQLISSYRELVAANPKGTTPS
jgi:branched-chain amino acid aminotransferase